MSRLLCQNRTQTQHVTHHAVFLQQTFRRWLLSCLLVFPGPWKRTKRRRYFNNSGRPSWCYSVLFLPTCQPWLSEHLPINYIRCLTILLCNNHKWEPGGSIVWTLNLTNLLILMFLLKELLLLSLHWFSVQSLLTYIQHNWCSSKVQSSVFLSSSSSLGMLDDKSC